MIQERILASRSFKRNDFVKSENSFNIDKLGSACQIILKNTEYIVADNTKNNEEILGNIFENSALVINNKEEIVDSLLDRHNKSSVVIPNTDIALFHTLDKELAEPFIIICSLNNVLAMKDAMGEEQRVEYFIIMVSPNEQEYTELLSQISIAILDDKIFGEALTSKNKNFILTKVELILKNYILQL